MSSSPNPVSRTSGSRSGTSSGPWLDFYAIISSTNDGLQALDRGAVREMVAKTQFAITGEDTRYFLNGALFILRPESMSLVSTDGHRLARVTVPKPDGAEGMPDVIIPRKCVAELRKLLDELEGTVEVSMSPTKIRFGLGSAVLTSKLIDGTFPDYQQIIPRSYKSRTLVSTSSLLKACKQAEIFARLGDLDDQRLSFRR